MNMRALIGADIFDGTRLHKDKVLLLDGDVIHAIVAQTDIPTGCEQLDLGAGTILPGFVDLQVNGGGGVMFNDETSFEGLVVISGAHALAGTHALLPTLITDTPERTHAAVDAVEKAIAMNVPGIIGIHLEGPHLSVARKGAHDPDLIRPMEEADEAFLIQTAARLPNVMVTVAPENVTLAQIKRLSAGGIIVSLGHSDCSYSDALAAFDAGACCVTHLFNAMSQISGREPGLVGAALDAPNVFAGLIADNIHVHEASMRVALTAKQKTSEIFLVSDAMSTVGSSIKEFRLNGRRVLRQNGRLTLEDGTLAGADLTLTQAISVLVNTVGVVPEVAFRMATSAPAAVLKRAQAFGQLAPGTKANALWMDNSLEDMVCL